MENITDGPYWLQYNDGEWDLCEVFGGGKDIQLLGDYDASIAYFKEKWGIKKMIRIPSPEELERR